jgi:hypothetical protein
MMQRASLVDSVVTIPNTAGIKIRAVKIRITLFVLKTLNFSITAGPITQIGPSKAYK